MKRITGLFAAAAMLISICSFSVFAFEDEGWSIEYAEDCVESDDLFANISKQGAINGKNGLYLYNNMATVSPVTVKSSDISFKSGTEYTLSLWTEGELSYMPNALKLGIDGVLAEKNIIRMTQIEQKGKYIRVSVSFVPENDITSKIAIKLNTRYAFEDKAAYAVIDDIAISNGIEDIYTCNFESIDNGGESFSQKSFSSDRYPKNVISTGWYGTVGLSWINPSNSSLYKIVVLDDDTGEVIADSESGDIKQGLEYKSGSISVVPGDINNLWIYDCAVDEVRNFRIKFIFSDEAYNNETNYLISGKASKDTSGYEFGITGFKFGTSMQHKERFNSVRWALDKETVHSGNAALRLYSNLIEGTDSYVDFYVDIEKAAVLEKDKTYRINLWVKGENVGIVNFMTDWDSKACPMGVMRSPDSTYDWKEILYDYTAEYDSTVTALRWRIYGSIESLWIDDISIYELDGDGNIIGENIAANGDFEQGYKDYTTYDVDGLTAESDEEGVKLTWNLPKKSVEKVKVYEIKNGEKTEIATLGSFATKFAVKDVVFNENHTYMVTTVNATGFESDGAACEIYPGVNGFAATDISLERDGIAVSDISMPGEYKIKVQIATDSQTEKEAELFALYSDNSVLKAADFCTVKIGKDSMKAAECILNIDSPSENGILKIFLWDSIEDMNSIKSIIQFE